MVEAGANLKQLGIPEEITLIVAPDTRYAEAIVACNFYEEPSKKFKLIGVTGTKGKTTTTYMIKEILEKADNIISAIRFSKDGKNINMPYSEEKIAIQDCIKLMKNKVLIAGQISEETKDIAQKNNCKIIDIMKKEEIVILNTIATAEGTIQILMENTDTILQGLKVLILGFGRVSKTLAQKLQQLQMEVTCAARKETDIAWIETYGYNFININHINEKFSEYDVIINTVPAQIITEKEMEYISKKTILIDLASYPGGVDFEKAKEKNLKVIWALGIPGKVAPETSAIFIKIEIEKLIKNSYKK